MSSLDEIKKSIEGIGPVTLPAIYVCEPRDETGAIVTRGIITQTGGVEVQAPHVMLEAGQRAVTVSQYIIAGHRPGWISVNEAMFAVSAILFSEVVRLRADLDAVRTELAEAKGEDNG